MNSDTKPKLELNLNSVLTVIVIGALGWMGTKLSNGNDALTKMEVQLPFMTQNVADLKAQVGQLVTRAELESRFADFTTKYGLIDKRVMALEFEKKKPVDP